MTAEKPIGPSPCHLCGGEYGVHRDGCKVRKMVPREVATPKHLTQGYRSRVHDLIRLLLVEIDPEPDRPGLLETPDRVARSYAELFAGYDQDPKEILKTFDEEYSDEMVLLKGVEFFSFCEHHLLPFSGTANIAYIPGDKKVVGLSKLARLLDVYARRLQIQERLTCQVTTALDTHLSTQGSACVISASHFCMVCRGVSKQHSKMVTASLTGNFRDPTVRREFYNLIGIS